MRKSQDNKSKYPPMEFMSSAELNPKPYIIALNPCCGGKLVLKPLNPHILVAFEALQSNSSLRSSKPHTLLKPSRRPKPQTPLKKS